MAVKPSKPAPLLSAFISHAKADAKKAQAIADGLEKCGFKCWIAPRDVRAGRSYGDEIIRGIESSRSFVLVLSKASNDSAFVAREVERATSKKKPIFAVRVANVEPSPALELFISGTQWIDAFSGRLGAHIDRLTNLLAEEEERNQPGKPEPSKDRPQPPVLPKWAVPLGAAAAVLLVLGAGIAFWPEQQNSQRSGDSGSLLTNPVWLPEQERQEREQIAAAEAQQQSAATKAQTEMAAAQAPGTKMIVGGRPGIDQTAETEGSTEMIVGGNPLGPLAAGDPDFRACEKSSEDAGIAACDRAIGSGKFTGRNLSYLYSDRGFMRMQKGAIVAALVDLNEAIEIDSTNFYAFWNRGALYAAQRDFDSARVDFTTALALNPDQASKAKIEEALNAVAASANAANTPPPSDKEVITVPTWGNPGEDSAAAEASVPSFTYPADAMPAVPPMATMPASPAAPPATAIIP